MIWFLLELDLLFTDFLLPALSFFWVGAIYASMIFLACWMLVVKLKYLRRLLYHEAATPALQDKVAGLMAVYGMGILGVGIMIKMMLEALRWNCQHQYKLLDFYWRVSSSMSDPLPPLSS